jgi:GntR family transcriptional regulator / MocR family aminotransferase
MPKNRALLDWIKIERDGGSAPLQRQISEQLRTGIRTGRLPPGTPLPSSRSLATHLEIARGTATAIYDRLIGEGLLHVRERSAIFVSETIDADAAEDASVAEELDAIGGVVDNSQGLPPPYTTFLPGVPAFDIFPSVAWAKLLGARCRSMTLDLAGENVHIGGYPALRTVLAEHLKTARGVVCEPSQIIVTNTARAALTALCRLLTRSGDRCLIEDPGYTIARRIIAGCGLEAVPIPADANGMRVEPPMPKARLAYITPTHQLPLGVGLSGERCEALLDWARCEDAWIVEDDYDSEFRYSGRPVVALQHSDPNGRVIYIGTFAKTLFPSLRVGFLVVPEKLASEAARAVFLNGQEPMLHVQAALADFISQGRYAAHIRRARAVYRRRQKLLVDGLNGYFDGIVPPVSQPAGGMNLFVRLPPDIPAQSVQSLAAKEKLHVRAVSHYAVRAEAPNAVLLGFAAVLDRLIDPAAERLARVIRSIQTLTWPYRGEHRLLDWRPPRRG